MNDNIRTQQGQRITAIHITVTDVKYLLSYPTYHVFSWNHDTQQTV